MWDRQSVLPDNDLDPAKGIERGPALRGNEPVFDERSSRLINDLHEGSLWFSTPHLKAETPAADP